VLTDRGCENRSAAFCGSELLPTEDRFMSSPRSAMSTIILSSGRRKQMRITFFSFYLAPIVP